MSSRKNKFFLCPECNAEVLFSNPVCPSCDKHFDLSGQNVSKVPYETVLGLVGSFIFCIFSFPLYHLLRVAGVSNNLSKQIAIADFTFFFCLVVVIVLVHNHFTHGKISTAWSSYSRTEDPEKYRLVTAGVILSAIGIPLLMGTLGILYPEQLHVPGEGLYVLLQHRAEPSPDAWNH